MVPLVLDIDRAQNVQSLLKHEARIIKAVYFRGKEKKALFKLRPEDDVDVWPEISNENQNLACYIHNNLSLRPAV